jgi:hypothetical protein
MTATDYELAQHGKALRAASQAHTRAVKSIGPSIPTTQVLVDLVAYLRDIPEIDRQDSPLHGTSPPANPGANQRPAPGRWRPALNGRPVMRIRLGLVSGNGYGCPAASGASMDKEREVAIAPSTYHYALKRGAGGAADGGLRDFASDTVLSDPVGGERGRRRSRGGISETRVSPAPLTCAAASPT